MNWILIFVRFQLSHSSSACMSTLPATSQNNVQNLYTSEPWGIIIVPWFYTVQLNASAKVRIPHVTHKYYTENYILKFLVF